MHSQTVAIVRLSSCYLDIRKSCRQAFGALPPSRSQSETIALASILFIVSGALGSFLVPVK